MYQKELRKCDRAIAKLEKDQENYILISNIETSSLLLRIHRTKSEQVKRECHQAISEHQLKAFNLEEELTELRGRKKRLLRSLAAVEHAIDSLSLREEVKN